MTGYEIDGVRHDAQCLFVDLYDLLISLQNKEISWTATQMKVYDAAESARLIKQKLDIVKVAMIREGVLTYD